jgi:hypothetical protein
MVAAPAGCRQRGGRTQETSEDEGRKTAAPFLAVHARMMPVTRAHFDGISL